MGDKLWIKWNGHDKSINNWIDQKIYHYIICLIMQQNLTLKTNRY